MNFKVSVTSHGIHLPRVSGASSGRTNLSVFTSFPSFLPPFLQLSLFQILPHLLPSLFLFFPSIPPSFIHPFTLSSLYLLSSLSLSLPSFLPSLHQALSPLPSFPFFLLLSLHHHLILISSLLFIILCTCLFLFFPSLTTSLFPSFSRILPSTTSFPPFVLSLPLI